jgi:3D (Asp-Asp-Asp) domain-containing protein
MEEPLAPIDAETAKLDRQRLAEEKAPAPPTRQATVRIGPPPPKPEWSLAESQQGPWPVTETQAVAPPQVPDGRLVGVFRNTYYDFPNERDFEGEQVALKDASCNTIREVPVTFHDAVCVQGSGTLANGETVSFAKRDCACARVCPRTDQRICFDLLSRQQFPWGRGAMGRAITPLLTVAVDSDVIPLGTPIYIPEFDGAPRDEQGTLHDGCFIAQDRGLRVKGKHVDVFTGQAAFTRLWNTRVPSNKGVHVYVDTSRCARAN